MESSESSSPKSSKASRACGASVGDRRAGRERGEVGVGVGELAQRVEDDGHCERPERLQARLAAEQRRLQQQVGDQRQRDA